MQKIVLNKMFTLLDLHMYCDNYTEDHPDYLYGLLSRHPMCTKFEQQ
jgi:hypothetical protein